MQGVLKKTYNNEKEYVISLNSLTTQEEKKEQIHFKKDVPKLDKYMSLIGHLLHVNSSMSNVSQTVNDNLDAFSDKRKTLSSNKTNANEGEQKFSIAHLKEKGEGLETHKKGFFLITDELNEDEEDDMSLKLKREVLVSKLMFDKSIIIDRQLQSDIYDSAAASLYLTLSHKSRQMLVQQYTNPIGQEEFNIVHNLIGLNSNSNKKNFDVCNETIMNLCQKHIKFEDLPEDRMESIMVTASDVVTEGNSIYPHSAVTHTTPNDDKCVVEDDTSKELQVKPQQAISQQQIEITCKKEENDEEFDLEEFDFFNNFVASSPNGPIKDKLQRFVDLIQSDVVNSNASGKKVNLTNKMKNGILRNLKKEYLNKLDELKKIEDEKKKEDEIVKKRNFKIENPFEETLQSRSNEKPSKSNKKSHLKEESPGKIKNTNVIYTSQGWGVSDNKKTIVNTSSNLSKKEEKFKKSPNISVNKHEGKRIIQTGNQRVIINDKLKMKPTVTRGIKSDWIGNNNDSDSSGEWVVQSNPKKN